MKVAALDWYKYLDLWMENSDTNGVTFTNPYLNL